MHERLVVAVFPAGVGTNPYLELLYDAMRDDVVTVPAHPFAPGWWRAARGVLDAVHLHWLEAVTWELDPVQAASPELARVHAAVLLENLEGLRDAGIPIVWTVHNLRPHDSPYPELDIALGQRVVELVDAVVVHSEFAAGRVREVLGTPRELVVAPHGHYATAYPPQTRTRAWIRSALHLPEDAFVYLMFGMIRTYKDVPAAVRAFAELPDPDARLLIAGWPHASTVDALLDAVHGEPRVVLDLEYIEDAELAEYHAAADAAVFNYAEVFSSGAVMLALSHGLPVVIPAASAAGELVLPGAAEAFAPGGLTAALARVRTGDLQARRAAALASAAACTWETAAERVLAAYRYASPAR